MYSVFLQKENKMKKLTKKIEQEKFDKKIAEEWEQDRYKIIFDFLVEISNDAEIESFIVKTDRIEIRRLTAWITVISTQNYHDFEDGYNDYCDYNENLQKERESLAKHNVLTKLTIEERKLLRLSST